MKEFKLPAFIIIGVAKSGTTSLYKALIKHPKIKPAKTKELYFFNKDTHYNKGVKYYKSKFAPCAQDEITGEATPFYLSYKEVPKRIKKYVPNVKLIAILRNPIDRAYSHFYGYLRLCKMNNKKPITTDLKIFVQMITEDPKNYNKLNRRGKALLSTGLYGEQMERWLKYFPLKQFMIIKSEDFFETPRKIINKVFDFIEIDKFEVPLVHYLKSTISNKRTLGIEKYSDLDEETRKILYDYYKNSNKLLYTLIKRDMKWE